MKQAGKTYEPVTYEGAGHQCREQESAEDAWKRGKDALKKL
jgi:dipeptidyl aminopeptidase/acylaminoacyl peptidase